MAGYFQHKMKRKGIEDINDDFSDFSLSSPATKIRRLDVGGLPPIIEEEEHGEIPSPMLEQEQSFGGNDYELGGLKIEELPNVPENQERAIVLFKPINKAAPLLQSPSNFSVDPHLVAGLKSCVDQVLRSRRSDSWRQPSDEAVTEENDSCSGNECQAVIPWVPPQYPSGSGVDFPSQIDNGEMMDAEELGESTMEVEDSTGIQHTNANEAGCMSLSEGLHPWQQQQQHFMIPQPPQNTNTPITWYG